MKLMVTGASGFIGRNVLLRAPREWEIVALYHRSRDFEQFLSSRKLTHVRPVQADLTDAGAVQHLARTAGEHTDAVLYLAANGDPAVSAERPGWDLQSNAFALVTFLEQVSAGHAVYVSSGAVYDGLVGPVTPNTLVSPRLPYAISKLASEQYVRFFCERRGSIGSYVNVRFFGAYGPYEAPRKITTRWATAMMQGQREFTVRGDGENLIDFMYVDDAADGFLKLVGAAGTRATVDVASGAPMSVNDVVRSLARAFGADVTIHHDGRTEEYIEFRTADQSMRERFGFTPQIAFEDGISRLRDFLGSSRT